MSLLAFYYAGFGIICIISSIVSLKIIYDNRPLSKTPLGISLVNLATAQLGFATFGYSTFVAPSLFANHWIWGEKICYLFASLKLFFQTLIYFAIFLLVLERYLIHFKSYWKFYKTKTFFVVIFLLYCYTAFWVFIPFFFGLGSYVRKEYTCTVGIHKNLINGNADDFFEFLRVFSTFVIPLTICFHWIGRIYLELRRNRKKITKLTCLTIFFGIVGSMANLFIILIGFLDIIMSNVPNPNIANIKIFPLETLHSMISQIVILLSPAWYFIFVPFSEVEPLLGFEKNFKENVAFLNQNESIQNNENDREKNKNEHTL